jgi:hypothetical protein
MDCQHNQEHPISRWSPGFAVIHGQRFSRLSYIEVDRPKGIMVWAGRNATMRRHAVTETRPQLLESHPDESICRSGPNRKNEDRNIAALRLKFDRQLLRVQEFIGSSHKHPDRSGGTTNVSEVVIMRAEVLLHAPRVRSSRGVRRLTRYARILGLCARSSAALQMHVFKPSSPRRNGGQGGN